jgi:hypothetical protein
MQRERHGNGTQAQVERTQWELRAQVPLNKFNCDITTAWRLGNQRCANSSSRKKMQSDTNQIANLFGLRTFFRPAIA